MGGIVGRPPLALALTILAADAFWASGDWCWLRMLLRSWSDRPNSGGSSGVVWSVFDFCLPLPFFFVCFSIGVSVAAA
jgi:hypothetical protein